MKISIVTITCRENPHFGDIANTLAVSAAVPTFSQRHSIEWVVVDDLIDASRKKALSAPFPIVHLAPKKATARPDPNGARNSGLAAATGEYVVFLNDNTVVTELWLCTVAQAIACVGGYRSKVEYWHNTIIPADGKIAYPAVLSKCIPAEASSVGSVFGAPLKAFEAIGGFDEAYSGGKLFDAIDAAIRLERSGVKFWSSRSASAIKLPSPLTSGDPGDRNEKLYNQLIRDAARILPSTEQASIADLRAAAAKKPTKKSSGVVTAPADEEDTTPKKKGLFSRKPKMKAPAKPKAKK